MAREILVYNGGINPVSSTLPYGGIKDNPGGTTIDEQSNGDIQQFFQRIADCAGVVYGNHPDNADNGWQMVDALGGGLNIYAAPIILQLIGSSYDAAKVYLLSGSATATDAGVVFYNGQCYLLEGFTGSICGGGQVQVINTVSSQFNTFMPHLKVECGVSGSGVVDYSALTRTFGVVELQALVALGAWNNASITGSGWTAYTPTPRYRKDGEGRVYLQGAFISTGATPSTDIFVLPAGYRPSATTLFPVMGFNGSVFSSGYIRVMTDGTVQILTVSSITGAGWWYDMGSIIFLNS